MCTNKITETARLIKTFRMIKDLNDLQRTSLETRYIPIIEEFSRRCRFYAFFFHSGHLIITIGSITVPALLSIQSMSSMVNYQDALYWFTWVVSLLVTIFNGILVLFKVDKKYYFLHTTAERLRSEGWQYIEQTGRYAGSLLQEGTVPTHANQFIHFCNHIEKIRMRQIEEEYFKYDENHPPTNHPPPNTKGPFYIESISKPITNIKPNNTDAAKSIKAAVNSIVAATEDVESVNSENPPTPPRDIYDKI